MSKTPVKPPAKGKKSSVGSRSFTRQTQSQQARAARRRAARQRAQARTVPSLGLKRLFQRLPRAAWICALVAFLNACAWAVITPPFQGKDETYHFAYVEHLAEYGTLPEQDGEGIVYAPAAQRVLTSLHTEALWLSPNQRSISTDAEQSALQEALEANASLKAPGGAGIASTEPPLFYALQSIPYAFGRGNILAQLQLMRLFDALLGALTALFAFLFLREALPQLPWTATVGGLCVALQPLLGFMDGSLAPDTMLYAVSAALFYFLARGFQRGLARRDAAAIGALTAIGFLTKLNFIGLSLGVFVGMAVLVLRAAKADRREALVLLGLSAGIGAAPIMLYALINLASGHSAFGVMSLAVFDSFSKKISYAWQLYLPRLPGMPHYFEGMHPYKDIWFDRSVGLYGWMDTVFPTWVDTVALIPAAIVSFLAARGLFLERRQLSRRLGELGVYALMALGVFAMIGIASYSSDAVIHKLAFGEPRYLLPLLPLLAAAIVMAVRGAGRRWAPATGAAIVVLFLAHDFFSQLQVIARYYG